MKQTYAVFTVSNGNLHMRQARDLGFKLGTWLSLHPIFIGGDTHIAKFYRSNKEHESGILTNTMPGSTFTNYKFERHTFGSGKDTVDVIVGWYW